jgi:hypothetical protein
MSAHTQSKEIKRLREVNTALLEALEAARDALVNVPTSLGYEDDLMPKIRAAIRQAKGESE